ncbi:hypothetical protein OPV22_034358 [Ensete ventricosum]|uniref:J domain-containing protein n=1 Tax=Ensete ventricosum TaxID=4639 RepID=A0AAV8PSA2_ENSVE|nr:hypothetical protein OPV22_034358 [Ensete ventricosum]
MNEIFSQTRDHVTVNPNQDPPPPERSLEPPSSTIRTLRHSQLLPSPNFALLLVFSLTAHRRPSTRQNQKDFAAVKTLTMLLTGKSFFRRIHYEVLSVKEHASYDEIRASYKTAILNSHPDKLKKKSEAFTDHQQDFLDVQKAWEVLSDSTSRANYDKELQLMRQELEVPANEIELGDMSVESVGDFEEFFYECRCGDYFSITWSELKEIGIILDKETIEVHSSTVSLPASVLIPCGSCSLKVRLTIDCSS